MKKIILLIILFLSLTKLCFGETIHTCTKTGNLECVQKELDENTNLINAPNSQQNQETPLHTAIKGNQEEIIYLLINKGADINAKDKFGWAPLHYGASKGYFEVVSNLAWTGADINITNYKGVTPLHTAVSSGFTNIVKFLINQKANIYAQDNYGWTPLHDAVYIGQSNLIFSFIEADKTFDKNVNQLKTSNGWSLLHWAAQKNHTDICFLLINQGADINAQNNNEDTPLHLAVRENNKKTIDLLLEMGAKSDIKNLQDKKPFDHSDNPPENSSRTNDQKKLEKNL